MKNKFAHRITILNLKDKKMNIAQEQKQRMADIRRLMNIEREYYEVYGYKPTFEEFYSLYTQGALHLTDEAEDTIIRLAEAKGLR